MPYSTVFLFLGKLWETKILLLSYIKSNSLTGTLHVIQVGSFILRPFSETLIVKINSELIGTVWKVMQYIFEVECAQNIRRVF